MRAAPAVAAALAALVALAGCGTGASAAGGDRDLPGAEAGPFRLLRAGETGNTAPFVLDRNAPWEAPAALDLDGDPATLGIALYVSWGAVSSITRYEVADGRTAKSDPVKVLAASEPWEQATGVGHPAPLQVGGEVWLYYASGGCIGRAVSADGGLTFARQPATPVLCGQDGPAWEGGALTAPSIHRGHDGRYHLLYEAAGAIGEAVSDDGVSFARQGDGPILRASGVDFDAAAVGEPCAVTLTSPLDRPVTLVYYTGHSAADPSTDRLATGLAARHGDAGSLDRATAPVLTRNDAHGPSVLRRGDLTLLYAAGRSSETLKNWKSVIVGGLAPADRALPAANEDGSP